MREIVLYGIAGAEKNYRVIRYRRIVDEGKLGFIKDLKLAAQDLAYTEPDVERVFVVDNSTRLRYYYEMTFRSNTMEAWICFKDILERWGFEMEVK